MGILAIFADDVDEGMARSARREAIRQEEGQPIGRAHWVVAEDLEHTRHRMMHGLPMAPLPCWRW